MAEIYFSGQGIVYAADRDVNGAVSVFRDLGNVSALKVTLETDTLEHKESRTGQRLTDVRLIREKRAKVTMTMDSFNKANLLFMLYGTTTATVGASVTNEILPSGLVAGDIVATAKPDISALTIVDSNATPASLVLGTNYTVDLKSGMITFVLVTGFTQPFKLNYTYAANDMIQIFKAPTKERYLRFVGVNTVNSNKPVIVELYRILFDPVGSLDLINDDLAKFEMTGSVLYDSTRDIDATLGGFGRIITPGV